MPTDKKAYMREYMRQRRARLKEIEVNNHDVSSDTVTKDSTPKQVNNASGIYGWLLFGLIMCFYIIITKDMSPDEMIAWSRRHKFTSKGDTQYA